MATILIIDDDTMAAGMLARALESAGYQVEQAELGKPGLEKALAEHPALILLDYQLPDATGTDILTELRKDEWGSKASVIMMTNVYELEIVNQAMALGVHDYVLKSDIQLDETVNLVGNYVPVAAE